MSTAELTTYEAQAITFPETKERLELVAKDCLALKVTDLADKEKILRFADMVGELELPALSKAAAEATDTLVDLVANFVLEIRGVADSLDGE